MCTVTFIPGKEKIIITSNRDEKHWRMQAIAPAIYQLNTGKVLFPKDGDAGGTWIAIHENGNAVIFLNGGFVPHTPKPPYRKSRGLILLDLIDGLDPYNGFMAINLNNIEPFTAVIWDENRLFECRWDGTHKHCLQLDETLPYIWSSVTLYTPDAIQKRKRWFEEWLQKNNEPTQKNILHFHQFTGDGDNHNDLMMNRGQVFTVSITSMEIEKYKANVHYVDVQNQQSAVHEISFEKSAV